MAETTERYPVATLHEFLEEASNEFRRFHFQATVNLIGSVVLLVFLARFVVFLSFTYGVGPLEIRMRGPFIIDSVLLIAASAAVVWSLAVWWHQRKFILRWGRRFEKLHVLESQLMPEEQNQP
jgi:hypothetical protein